MRLLIVTGPVRWRLRWSTTPTGSMLQVRPSALQNSMTIEKMLAGQRSPRNSIIVEIMRGYGYVDARGMGARRKIVPLTRGYAGKDADVSFPRRFRLPSGRV